MNNYNPHIHHRHSIRLKGYDYSQSGLYYITICVQDRKCLFGKIVRINDVRIEDFEPRQREMILNDAGKIADNCWLEIPKHFPNAVLHEYIIMPNHVHGIIELIKTGLQCESVANVGVQNFEQGPYISTRRINPAKTNIKKSSRIPSDQLSGDLKSELQIGFGIIMSGFKILNPNGYGNAIIMNTLSVMKNPINVLRNT